MLRSWLNLCQKFCAPENVKSNPKAAETRNQVIDIQDDDSGNSEDEFEVESLIGIRYKQPTQSNESGSQSNESGLQFKVSW